MTGARAIHPVEPGGPQPTVVLGERRLVVSFPERVRACSWAVVGGGFVETRHVAWVEVTDAELRPPVDPRRFLAERLRTAGLAGAVGLLTSRDVRTYSEAAALESGVRAGAFATVGLGNALRAGDPAGASGRIGTINVVVHADVPLSDGALLEASAIATEAKCAAVLEAGVRSRRTDRPATGTGTDCIVVVAVASGRGRARYAGKHTAVGAAIGRAVELAVTRGVERWLREGAG